MKYLLILVFLLTPSTSYCGDGHDHGDSSFAGAAFLTSFELSDKAIKNLDLQTSKVKKESLQKNQSFPCIIKNPPEESSIVSVNYMSKVEKIYVRLGEKVRKGQALFSVFSFKTVGNIDVLSPIDGVISAQNVKVGQVVQQDTNLAEISTMKYFIAEGLAYLSDDISHINVGDIANIKIDGTHENAKGVVKSFSPIVDTQNKTKSILAYFESKDEHIFPNMHCQMDVFIGEPRSAIAVPKKAVLGDFGNYFVFIKHDNHFERQDVVVGFKNSSYIEILEGLKEGQDVVINGNYQLQFVNASGDDAHKEDEHAHDKHDKDEKNHDGHSEDEKHDEEHHND